MAAQLSALAVPAPDYAAWRTQVATRQRIDTRVAGVRFEGTQRVNPQYLESLTRIRAGDRVNNDALSADARRMAVVQEVESVNYDLTGDPANPVLVWHVQEKQLGPDYFIPTLGLYFGGGGDTDFVLAMQYSRRWVNALGAEWRATAQIGDTALLDTSFYQPLSASQRFFVQPDAFISRSIEDIYNDYQRVATYRFADLGLVLDAGTNLSLFTQLRFGYWIDRRRLSVDTGPAVLPVLTTTDAGPQGQWTYDSREASSFAREGMAAEVEYLSSTESLGAKRDWQRAEAAFRKSISLGKLDLWLTAAGGTKLGNELPADRAFSLGGPQSFPGYSEGEVRAREYWVVYGNFLYPLANLVPLKSETLYGGMGLEMGEVRERVDPVPSGYLYGISAYFGGRTPLGTVTFGLGAASHSWALWLTLGRPVGQGTILNEPLFR
jgi:NTE family protein